LYFEKQQGDDYCQKYAINNLVGRSLFTVADFQQASSNFHSGGGLAGNFRLGDVVAMLENYHAGDDAFFVLDLSACQVPVVKAAADDIAELVFRLGGDCVGLLCQRPGHYYCCKSTGAFSCGGCGGAVRGMCRLDSMLSQGQWIGQVDVASLIRGSLVEEKEPWAGSGASCDLTAGVDVRPAVAASKNKATGNRGVLVVLRSRSSKKKLLAALVGHGMWATNKRAVLNNLGVPAVVLGCGGMGGSTEAAWMSDRFFPALCCDSDFDAVTLHAKVTLARTEYYECFGTDVPGGVGRLARLLKFHWPAFELSDCYFILTPPCHSVSLANANRTMEGVSGCVDHVVWFFRLVCVIRTAGFCVEVVPGLDRLFDLKALTDLGVFRLSVCCNQISGLNQQRRRIFLLDRPNSVAVGGVEEHRPLSFMLKDGGVNGPWPTVTSKTVPTVVVPGGGGHVSCQIAQLAEMQGLSMESVAVLKSVSSLVTFMKTQIANALPPPCLRLF
jgi:hypothetical protein